MIEYANELIEEIKNNKPSNATTITVSGIPIDAVRYGDGGLEIICDIDLVDKDDFEELENEKEDLEYDNQELEGEIEFLNEDIERYIRVFNEITDKIDTYEENLDILDEIYNLIEARDEKR